MHFLFAYRNAKKELRSIFFPYFFILFVYFTSEIYVSAERLSIFVVLRSDRLRLVPCNFSSSIAKQIHFPVQLVIANLGCFPSQVLCNMFFFTIHSFVILQNSGKFLRNDCISIETHLVHSTQQLKK